MSRPELPVAAHLSQEEIEERAQVAHQLMEGIREALAEGRTALWKLAAYFYHFEEEKAWKPLGFEERRHWLADPEVSTTERTYQRLIGVYRTYAVRRNVDPPSMADLDISKADIVRGALESGAVTLEEAIADITTLGQRDLREKYAKPPSEKPQETPAEAPVVEQPVLSAQDAGELDEALLLWHETIDFLIDDDVNTRLVVDRHKASLRALHKLIAAYVPADTIVPLDEIL